MVIIVVVFVLAPLAHLADRLEIRRRNRRYYAICDELVRGLEYQALEARLNGLRLDVIHSIAWELELDLKLIKGDFSLSIRAQKLAILAKKQATIGYVGFKHWCEQSHPAISLLTNSERMAIEAGLRGPDMAKAVARGPKVEQAILSRAAFQF